MLGFNRNQWIGIIIATASVLAVAPTEQVVTLFGVFLAAKVQAAASLLTLILGSVIAAINNPASMIQQVKDLPGVANIQINRDAPKSIAQASLDPDEGKIEPAPGQTAAVQAVAKS